MYDALTEAADLGTLVTAVYGPTKVGDSPGSIELHQPQTVTLDHLPVEVGGVELNDIIASRIKGLDRQDQGAAQHSWRTR